MAPRTCEDRSRDPDSRDSLRCRSEFVLALDLRLTLSVFVSETRSSKSGWRSSSAKSTLYAATPLAIVVSTSLERLPAKGRAGCLARPPARPLSRQGLRRAWGVSGFRDEPASRVGFERLGG